MLGEDLESTECWHKQDLEIANQILNDDKAYFDIQIKQ